LLVKMVIEREVTAKVVVNERTLRAYYDADPSRFVVPEQVRFRQIVIAVDPGSAPSAWLAAESRAAALARQVRKGKAFADLARAHSQDDASREQGGEMGWVHRGQLDHDPETAIFALDPGGVSDPVRTLYGYAVYQVDAKKPQRALAYDDVNTARLTEELRRAETDRVRSVWLTALRQRATVEVRSAP